MRYSAGYTSEGNLQAVELHDSEAGVTVRVVPGCGANAISLKSGEHEFLWQPDTPFEQMVSRKQLCGIPFLGPWANRLGDYGFSFEAQKYTLDKSLGNLRFDHDAQPIHGLLLFEPWEVRELHGGNHSAEVVCTLPFGARPALMSQFPFPHELELRHAIREGSLHIQIGIRNEGTKNMPVSHGFHPYFALSQSRRDEWTGFIPSAKHVLLSPRHLPTGEIGPWTAGRFAVKDANLDDVFTELIRDADGYARFSLESATSRLTVAFDSAYPVGVVFAPPAGQFVCFEPMAALTNALNSGETGILPGPQTVAPGETWRGEFIVTPELRAN